MLNAAALKIIVASERRRSDVIGDGRRKGKLAGIL